MTMLSSSSPVTATTRSGGRAMPARSSTNSSVASPRIARCSNSSSSASQWSRRCSTIATSWPPRRSVRARFEPTFPPPATRTNIALAGPGRRLRANRARLDGLGEDVDRTRCRAHDAQPEGRVELGARWIKDADHGAVDAKALLCDLADDDVGVVAVRGHDDCVRLFDAGVTENLHVHSMTDDESSRPVLPEPAQRLFGPVDCGHFPARFGELLRNLRPDSPAP